MDPSIWCFCFKVLCPDRLVNRLLGPVGRTKKAIQEETDTFIAFSDLSDRYPSTSFRVLSIHAKTIDIIGVVLQKIVERLVECATHERPRLSLLDTEPEFCGKENDDYLIRIVICSRAAADIVGEKGSGIIAIREATGSRVFVDRPCHAGHQLVKVVGTAEGIMGALDKVNDAVQTLSGEPWYRGWAAFNKYSETVGDESSWYTWWESDDWALGVLDGGFARERTPRRQGREEEEVFAGSGDALTPQSSLGSTAGGADNKEALLEALSEAAVEAQHFVKDELEAPFTLTCDLTLKATGAIRTVMLDIANRTDTRIHFEPVPEDPEHRQCLVIEGALLSTYIAHTLLMKRYHEIEKAPEKVEMASDGVSGASQAAKGFGRTVMKGKGLVKGKRVRGKGKYGW